MITGWTSSPLWTAVGLTMLHYLWLGGCVGIVAAVLRWTLVRRGAAVRYATAVALLAALAVMPAVIFAGVWSHVSRNGESISAASPAPQPRSGGAESSARSVDASKSDGEANSAAACKTAASSTEPPASGSPGSESRFRPPSHETLSHEPLPTADADRGFTKPTGGQPARTPVEPKEQDQPLAPQAPSTSRVPDRTLLSERSPRTERSTVPGSSAVAALIVRLLPWLWLIGTPLTFLFLSVGLAGASRLRRSSRPLDDKLNETCRRLARSLRVTRRVAVAACDRVLSPVLVGILRPVILLPSAALAGWSPEQLEMVLLHELAHVRRWDNLVNLWQRIVESLLFYQPAVWLVSDWIRREREHCCDELVVAHTGRPRDYAEMLARLAAAHSGRGRLLEGGLSSSMARSHLVARVRYLLHREYEPMQVSAKVWSLFAVGLIAVAGIAGWQTLLLGRPQTVASKPAPTGGQRIRPVVEQPVLVQPGAAGVDDSSPKSGGRAKTGDSGADRAGAAEDAAGADNIEAEPASEIDSRLWNTLGVKVRQTNLEPPTDRFHGGLEIVELNDAGPASGLGLRQGDVLVGAHRWVVTSLDDLAYVLRQPDVAAGRPVKLYVRRNGETMFLTGALVAAKQQHGDQASKAEQKDESSPPRQRAGTASPAGDQPGRNDSAGKAGADVVAVRVVEPQSKRLSRDITQPATVRPWYQANVYSQVAGYLKELKVDIGDTVAKGDVLAVVDVPEIVKRAERQQATVRRVRADQKRAAASVLVAKAGVESARAAHKQAKTEVAKVQANLAASKAEFDRVTGLVQQEAASARQLEEARQRYQSAQAAKDAAEAAAAATEANVVLAQAQQITAEADLAVVQATIAEAEQEFEETEVQIDFATLRAPFAGVVTERHVAPGDLVRNMQASSGDSRAPLLTIARLDRVRVEVAVPEDRSAWIDVGDKAAMQMRALRGREFAGRVSRIARRFDERTRTMTVEIDLANDDAALRPGMTGQATISPDQEKPSLVLPSGAVHGRGYVYVVGDDNRIKIVNVKTGQDDGQQIEILDGLRGGERIVATNAPFTAGQKVRIEP